MHTSELSFREFDLGGQAKRMAYPWSKVVFTHQGGAGNLLGPGRQDAFELTTNKQARIEGEITENGRGTYQATVS
jgi:hypothetical protein